MRHKLRLPYATPSNLLHAVRCPWILFDPVGEPAAEKQSVINTHIVCPSTQWILPQVWKAQGVDLGTPRIILRKSYCITKPQKNTGTTACQRSKHRKTPISQTVYQNRTTIAILLFMANNGWRNVQVPPRRELRFSLGVKLCSKRGKSG